MAEHILGPLHWERVGTEGRPMVFVHANPMDGACWLYQTAHLSTWFQTIAVDLPGYGRSPKATPGLTMADVGQACWEAVDEATSEPAVLVGLSVGSAVVHHMAVQRPDRTLALVMAGKGHNPGRDYADRIAGYREQGLGFRYAYTLDLFSPAFRQTESARYVARMFRERSAHADVDTICELFRALAEPMPEAMFTAVRAPTLIVGGSLDRSHATHRALHERMPGSEFRSVQGAGHACNIEQPWAFDGHLLDFLARHGLFAAPDPEPSDRTGSQGQSG